MDPQILSHLQQPAAQSGLDSLAVRTADTAVRAGSMILEAGAEVYRVEETMQRLGLSIPGVRECIAYVSATGIMCTAVCEDGMATRVARIFSGQRNLWVLNAVNSLSRESEASHFDVAEINRRLDDIARLPVYSEATRILFAAIGAAGFAFFFDGSLADMAASFVIGLLLQSLGSWLNSVHLHGFLVSMFQAFAAVVLSWCAHSVWPDCTESVVVISSLMLLVPGLAITNAIRDTMMGDYLSGMVRLMEAFIAAAALAIGAGLGLYLVR